MSQKDKRIDAYISKSAEFAKPVLQHLRTWFTRRAPMWKKPLNGECLFSIIKGRYAT